MRACTACWVGLLSLLQIATAVTVIAITAVQLANVDTWQGLLNQKVCLLSADPTNLSVCYYVYAVGAVSVCFTVLIGLLQLVTCNMCGCGKVMDAVFTAIAAIWWLAAGFITAHHTRAANAAKLKGRDWRNAVVLLSWITSGLFVLLFVTHMSRICSSCLRKRRKGRVGNASDPDLEKAELRKGRAPSAAVELGKEISSRPYMSRLGRQQQQQPSSAAAALSGPNI